MGRVAICVPTRGTVRAEWAFALRKLVLPADTDLYSTMGHGVDLARNTLAQKALDAGAEHIFFLDDDVVLPKDALVRMVQAQEAVLANPEAAGRGWGGIISGLYWLKWNGERVQGAFLRRPGGLQYDNTDVLTPWTQNGEQPGALVPVDGVPGGCLLIHRSVLERVPKPWFVMNEGGVMHPDLPPLSEDFMFCHKAAQAGITPLLMPGVRAAHNAAAYFAAEDGELRVSGAATATMERSPSALPPRLVPAMHIEPIPAGGA